MTRFGDSREPLAEIARQTGADAIIEGSVGLVQGRVRMTARLVHGASDRQLWSASYERPVEAVPELQSELASAVAQAVHLTVRGGNRAGAAGRAVDSEAYILYLRGRHFFNLRGREAVEKAIGYFQQAIARDASFAAAYGGLALSYCLLIESQPAFEVYPRVRQAAVQALALDPEQSDALLAMTQVTFYSDRDWRKARRDFDRLLERDPNHALARLWYGSLLTAIGPLDDALAERQRALRLDPLSVAASNSLAVVLMQLGRYDEAVHNFKNAIEVAPDYADAYGWLGTTYIRMGRHEEGVVLLQRCAALSHDHARMVARLAHGYGLAGRAADGRRLVAALTERARTQWVPPIYFAYAFAGLGDRDRAFARLEEAVTTDGMIMRIKFDPLLDPLKSDPRFTALLRRLSLPSS
jgi:tetratricopeptide (TPR) repeat protein